MNLDQYIGQSHLLGDKGPITKILNNHHKVSLVLYGPPGIGKTTLANIIASNFDCSIYNKNAATIKFDELREICKATDFSQTTFLILDEVHRLDKRAQNFLLPYLEADKLFIIGTTTENPFFALSAAMRSRLLLFNLKPISKEDLVHGLANFNHLKYPDQILDFSIYETIHAITSGDVRMSLNIVDFMLKNYEVDEIDASLIKELFVPSFVSDKNESNHYDLLSAFQKSIRGSDVNASLHYLARLLNSGDHVSLMRRLVVIAYEDIGLANPQAVDRTLNAILAFERVGMPEGKIPLAFAVTELALSPKCTTSYTGIKLAMDDLDKYGYDQIPSNLLDRQPHKTPYIKQEVAVSDNLPKNLHGNEYFIYQNSSKYEAALNQNYEARKDVVKNGKK